ncbi:DUF362 domain-containing protein [Candidatus Latescibacterota bacterium]
MSTVGVVGSDHVDLADPVARDRELTVAQVEGMVRRAVELAGGFGPRLEPGAASVVIKPNIVEVKTRGSGVITDWRVVRALVRMVHEVAPQARISIAEGAAWVPPERADEIRVGMHYDGWGDGFEVAGYRDLLTDPELEGINLDIVDLNFDEAIPVQTPGGGYVFETYHLPNTVLECDFLISVPVLKVIGAVGMTNAMKNFVGIAPGLIYGFPKMRGYPGSGVQGLPHSPSVLDEVIADLVSVSGVDYAVVDAIVGMERAKTDRSGMAVRLNTIVAGADIVAVDATSAQLIGFNPADIEYLNLATLRALGQWDPRRIQVNGSAIAEVGRRFEKDPSLGRSYGDHGHYGQGCRTWLLRGPFSHEEGGEEPIDPADPGALPGEGGWTVPVYFHDDKIDLDKYYDDPFNCAVYAYAEFDAPRTEAAELWVGSDEGMKVWINGELVYEHQGRRRHRLPNERLQIQLTEGHNSLLVRAEQGRSRFDFSVNICEVEDDPRYDGNRVAGLYFTVPAARDQQVQEATELAAASDESDGVPPGTTIIDTVSVGRSGDSLTGVLEAAHRMLGGNLSPERLRGVTGHAFRMAVGDSLDEDLIAAVDVGGMAELHRALGFEVRVLRAEPGSADLAQRQEEAWGTIRTSLDSGRPVIVHGGWSYQLVTGYHSKREQYHVVGPWGSPGMMAMDELGSDRDIGLQAIALDPAPVGDPQLAERHSLEFAVSQAHATDEPGTGIHRGFAGYEYWIEALEQGWAEHMHDAMEPMEQIGDLRIAAAAYLRALAEQYPTPVAKHLRRAAADYERVVEHLEQGGGRRRGGGGDYDAQRERQEMRKLAGRVRGAYESEQRAIASIEMALEAMQ